MREFELEIGMPHLGLNGLSERALFMAVGHERWRHLEALGGTPTALIHDDAGERLYGSFSYVEVDFPADRPLAAFGENECMCFGATLEHHAGTYLDGRFTLAGDPRCVIRATNVFVAQARGPEQLSIASPANVDLTRIPASAAVPDSIALCRAAKANGTFFEAPADAVSLYEGVRSYRHVLDPDRDSNGAGLIYFANYIAFLDAAERHLLGALPRALLDGRSTFRRRIGYFGNANGTDTLLITMAARARRLSAGGSPSSIELLLDARITRESDGRLIAVSSCSKLAPLTGDIAVAGL